MPSTLFNSPQKQWVREFFWLPILQGFNRRSGRDLKYLTFAGPEGHDIEFFLEKQVFSLENVRVWERSSEAAQALIAKFGINIQVKPGEAFTLCKAPQEQSHYPYGAINLDFTNGAFSVQKPRYLPNSFEIVKSIIAAQKEHTESFLLFAAFAANSDVDSEFGKSFVQKIAFDIATRFGFTEPLFDLTRDQQKTYFRVLAAVIPCVIIRLGIDHFYDVQCVGKAIYAPNNSKRTSMLCMAFEFSYDFPPLSETTLQGAIRLNELAATRQRESLNLETQDVNSIVRTRRTRGPARSGKKTSTVSKPT